MWRRQSFFPTVSLMLGLASPLGHEARAAGPPIQLEESSHYPFTGSSLQVADLDAADGPDLAGLNGTDVVFILNDGHGAFGALQTLAMGAGALSSFKARDLDGDGRVDLVAISPMSGAIVTRINAGGGSFASPELAFVPGSPGSHPFLSLGDLDGDARPDAVALLDSGYIAVMMNDGAGHLQPGPRFLVDGAYTEPQLVDFNGDGKTDLLMGSWLSSFRLCFLAGRGDGTFETPVVTPARYFSPSVAAAADMDGDGDLDFLTSNEANLLVFPNRGDGTFDPAVVVPFPFESSGLWNVAVGDVDHDGHTDIAIVEGTNLDMGRTNYLGVIFNRGGLAFGPMLGYPVGPWPNEVALVDLDGDGWLEGVAICRERGWVWGWGYSGDNAFVFHNRQGALEGLLQVHDPVWLPARSGRGILPDLFGSAGGLMYRARNRGNGTFDSAVRIGWGDPRLAVDLDGDGDEELLVRSGDSTWVLPSLGSAGFGPPGFTLVGSAFRDLADFNGDGKLDLLATHPDSELVMFPGDGACGFGPPVHYGRTVPAARDADDVRGGDLDHDGFADVLYSRTEEFYDESGGFGHVTKLFALVNDRVGGLGTPDSSVDSTFYFPPRSHGPGFLRLGDWNGDGVKDAVHVTDACMSGSGATEEAFLGVGDGTFRGAGPAAQRGSSWCDVQAADLNGDRFDDLVYVISTSGYTFHALALTSNGTGGFDENRYPMGYQPVGVWLADVDGDGRADIVTHILDWTTSTCAIRRNVTPIGTPTPTLVSLTSSRVEDGVVHLEWFASLAPFSAAIERRSTATDWSAIGHAASDGTGHLRYEDRDVAAGERYAYRLRTSDSEGERVSAESWVSVPGAALSFHGTWPNPSSGAPAFSFSLPSRGAVEILVYDIAGRIVHRERIDGLSPGTHRVGLTGPALRPGVYLARLVFRGQKLQRSLVILR